MLITGFAATRGCGERSFAIVTFQPTYQASRDDALDSTFQIAGSHVVFEFRLEHPCHKNTDIV